MILVANHLYYEPLLDLLSARLAIDLAAKNVEQIREFFDIKVPFATPELEAQVLKENQEAIEIYDLENDED